MCFAQNMNKTKKKPDFRVKKKAVNSKREGRAVVAWEWILKIKNGIQNEHILLIPDQEEVKKSMINHFKFMFPGVKTNNVESMLNEASKFINDQQ